MPGPCSCLSLQTKPGCPCLPRQWQALQRLLPLLCLSQETPSPPPRSPQCHSALRPPCEGAQDSPVPTLAATAGEHVLCRHLHVDMPVGVDADPIRNGLHSPKCLREQVLPSEEAAMPHLWPLPPSPRGLQTLWMANLPQSHVWLLISFKA